MYGAQGRMRDVDAVRPIAKQSATSAKREARRGQTALRLFGLLTRPSMGSGCAQPPAVQNCSQQFCPPRAVISNLLQDQTTLVSDPFDCYEWTTQWVEENWPFAELAYPGRSIEWTAWDQL